MDKVAVAIVLILMNSFAEANACVRQKVFDESGGQIKLGDSSFSYADDESRRIITTFATVRNTSNACVENIQVEVKYFDGSKNLIDVVNQTIDNLSLPPGQEATFRVRDRADKSKLAYSSSTIRIVSVDQKIAPPQSTNTNEEPSLIASLIVGWGPMLLLIGVWIFFMRSFTGKNSAHVRQAVALDRIASTLEKSAPARGTS